MGTFSPSHPPAMKNMRPGILLTIKNGNQMNSSYTQIINVKKCISMGCSGR